MSLKGRVALVTGASRGIGRGCAKALADEGATVYITGRKIETLSQTAREIGGEVVPVACDHSDDNQVEKLFKRIDAENSGRLDLLVNNCYSGVPTLFGMEGESSTPVNKFWEQTPKIWDAINNVGLRANYIASVYAARLMVPRGEGLIVNMSSPGGLSYTFNVAYSVGKAAQDRMAQDFNVELKGTGVKALSLWPRATETEFMRTNVVETGMTEKAVDVWLRNPCSKTDWQSIQWVGKTVAALLSDPNLDQKAGRTIWCDDIANEFDIRELDGSKVTHIRSMRHNIVAYNEGRFPWYLALIPEGLFIPQWLFNFGLWVKGNKF
ncbi:Oidioi.mRNA.OKI2018_I69.chr1.g3133.t1.cds [Oikopleura dioica]|uniref:Oidioi.mRNA.OKI2018_I69.chr1.g3133.t1.cds n=1 Tax=Oikopleura dioica TaxID=34765 RepID=A0ABN7ST97_OIKDI|nr:Oidioi.mRNA.OKI2018_I69.chr1.g3133.t1.cds [Oikopleura dioica]